VRIDSAVTAGSATDVISAARRQYRQLSMLVHPDRCQVARAEDAFAALGRAMAVISGHVEALPISDLGHGAGGGDGSSKDTADVGGAATRAEDSGKGGGNTEEDCRALGPLHDGHAVLDKIAWTQSRLVLQAVALPSNLASILPTILQSYAGVESAEGGNDPLLFLPLEAIPSLRASVTGARGSGAPDWGPLRPTSANDDAAAHAGRSTEGDATGLDVLFADQPTVCQLLQGVGGESSQPETEPSQQAANTALRTVSKDSLEAAVPSRDAAAQALPPKDVDRAAVMADLNASAAASAEDSNNNGVGEEKDVEGLLLLSCRAALRGRFPLNGTYFQMNECFVSAATVTEPIKVGWAPG
jgi:hypothetical protein